MNVLTVGPTMTENFVFDTSVIISFIEADIQLLNLVAHNIGNIFITESVFMEVKKQKDELRHISYKQIEEHDDDFDSAPTIFGATSTVDNIAMLTAKRHGYICVTNDRPLRNLCEKYSVDCKWGLELIIELVKTKIITKDRATTMFSKSGIDKRYPNVKDIFHQKLSEIKHPFKNP